MAGPTIAVALLITTLDQTVKSLLTDILSSREGFEIVIIDPILKLRLVHNSGLLFGMFSGTAAPWVFTVLVVTAMGALIWVYSRQLQRPTLMARLVIGLTFGGALGNLIDRFRFGYVVDYVEIGWWPVFNLADAAINISIILFLLLLVAGRLEKPPDISAPFTQWNKQ